MSTSRNRTSAFSLPRHLPKTPTCPQSGRNNSNHPASVVRSADHAETSPPLNAFRASDHRDRLKTSRCLDGSTTTPTSRPPEFLASQNRIGATTDHQRTSDKNETLLSASYRVQSRRPHRATASSCDPSGISSPSVAIPPPLRATAQRPASDAFPVTNNSQARTGNCIRRTSRSTTNPRRCCHHGMPQ